MAARGDFAEVLWALQPFLASSQPQAEVLLLAAQCHIGQRSFAAGLACLDRVGTERGQDRLHRMVLAAQAYAGLCKFVLAREIIDSALTSYPFAWEPYEQFAALDIAEGKVTGQTMSYLHNAMTLAPAEPRVYITAGWASLAGADVDSARTYFQHAESLAPGDLRVREGLDTIRLRSRQGMNGINLKPFTTFPEPGRDSDLQSQGERLLIAAHTYTLALGIILTAAWFLLMLITYRNQMPLLPPVAGVIAMTLLGVLMMTVIGSGRPKPAARGRARYFRNFAAHGARQNVLLLLSAGATAATIATFLSPTLEETWPAMWAGFGFILVFLAVFWGPALGRKRPQGTRVFDTHLSR